MYCNAALSMYLVVLDALSVFLSASDSEIDERLSQ